jgi:hypothetical protein
VVYALNQARRWTVLDVSDDRLTVVQTSIFASTRHEWPGADIIDIRTGSCTRQDENTDEDSESAMPVWGVEIELQVHQKTGKKFGLLLGRDEQELRWLATMLRRALRIPSTSRKKM